MNYSASMHNNDGELDVVMKVGDRINTLQIAPKRRGYGSSISGGEMLFLAIATCYCNDLYREGRKLGIQVDGVEVDVDGEFGEPGDPAWDVKCKIKVIAQASEEEIRKLVEHTDAIAEIPKSIRNGTPISLSKIVAVSTQ